MRLIKRKGLYYLYEHKKYGYIVSCGAAYGDDKVGYIVSVVASYDTSKPAEKCLNHLNGLDEVGVTGIKALEQRL